MSDVELLEPEDLRGREPQMTLSVSDSGFKARDLWSTNRRNKIVAKIKLSLLGKISTCIVEERYVG